MLYELEIALAQVPAPGEGEAPRAVAGRPAVPQPAGRRHRQHPPRRDLHRQAVLARRADRPARPGRIPLVRDAAGCAHEPRAATAAARAGRLVLARAAATARWCAGAPRCTTASCSEHFVWEDFLGVLDDLRRAGYPFDPVWFEAQREFRFPFYGAVEHGGVQLELRHALEPWHVLGEERRRRRHRALRRFLGRAAAGEGRRVQCRRATSSPATAAACR